MDETNDATTKTRYVWPWFVLAALVLGVVLAIVWVSAEVRRTRERRESNPLQGPTVTNNATKN